MQCAGQQGAGHAQCLQPAQVVRIPYAAGRVQVMPGMIELQALQTIDVGAAGATHVVQAHDDDAGRPQRGRHGVGGGAEKPTLPIVQRKDVVVLVVRERRQQAGGDRLTAQNGGTDPQRLPAEPLVQGRDAGVHPQLELRETAGEIRDNGGLPGPAGEGIQVGDVEAREGVNAQEGGDDLGGQIGAAQRAAQGRVVTPLATGRVYRTAAGEIDHGYHGQQRQGAPMRILVVEYITGGGLIGQEWPPGLGVEAELMVDALVRDLADLPGIEVLVSRDPRLAAPAVGCRVFVPCDYQDIWEQWAACLQACDAVWPIMPETGGLLQRISELAGSAGRLLLNSRPPAVATAGSKRRTAQRLGAAGIDVVATFDSPPDDPAAIGSRWIVKPDDGVGCEGIRIFDSLAGLCRHFADRGPTGLSVVQPLIEGDPLSLSLLCRAGEAGVLCVNRQRLREEDGRLSLYAIQVNIDLTAEAQRFARLATAIARALPGLWGYVGVDMIRTPDDRILVLEVNPRLTTSYAALRTALRPNVAAQVLSLLDPEAPLPVCERLRTVTVTLDGDLAHVA